MVVGPVAVSETVFAETVPPLSLVMVLTRVSTGATSLLVMAHDATSPAANVRLLPESVPPEQLQALAE